ncbi:MAG: succinate dehydrogenase, cytochrome b556 subunit [Pseudomonadota bacterium]
MADVNRGNRPLSPHLSIYRPQMTSMSSIMVRVSGIGAFVAALIIAAWLLAAATSPGAFELIDGALQTAFGRLVLFGATWCLFYNMLGRLRHVIWDFGYCLDVATSEKLALGMFGGATILTVLVAFVG